MSQEKRYVVLTRAREYRKPSYPDREYRVIVSHERRTSLRIDYARTDNVWHGTLDEARLMLWKTRGYEKKHGWRGRQTCLMPLDDILARNVAKALSNQLPIV